MAEAAVAFLLEQVKEVILVYKDLISGAEKEFDGLNEDLAQLKAVLKDMAKRSTEEHLIKQMEKQIREVVYEVEDTIDTCLSKAREHEPKSKRTSFKRRLISKSTIDLAKMVKSLRDEKVKPLLTDAKNMYANMTIIAPGSTSGTTPEQQKKIKKDQSIRPQDKVVGFEDEEETLTGYLMTYKENQLDVISIIGMPGLGKTTLAWKIFNSETICYEFPIRIWAYISQKFNFRDVLLNIMKKFSSQDMSSMNDHELGHTVRACLEKERFLLAMDDVWGNEVWDAIKHVLPTSNGKGKVLITSRDINIGTHASLLREPHNLRFLTEKESWELLQLEVFGNTRECPPQLQGMGKRIAKECDGVPLTIVVMGGILVDQFMKTRVPALVKKEWEKVSQNVSQALEKDKEKHITNVVSLSYERLPDDLRECFLYLGAFPEGHEISVWTLTSLWIAEGFILPKKEQSFEETAVENLDDLISRNLLMVVKRNPMGEVKICSVHDMIRSFCREKALEQNLFQEIKMTEQGGLDALVSHTEKPHRLCLHSDPLTFLRTKQKGPCVRSFLCFHKDPIDLDPEYNSAIPNAFELLRILHSQCIRFNQFPQGVTELIHLRYITLCVDNLDVLPEPISHLWNLRSLVVYTKSRSLKMKANIWKMIQLRHFKTKAAIVLDPKWEGEAGKKLQTLDRLAPESATAVVRKRAGNLKTLGIRGKLAAFFENMFLGELANLQKMKLVNDLHHEAASENPLQCLPDWNCFPPTLRRLTLSNTFLDWKHMSTLAMIVDLEVLKLKDNAFTGILWDAVAHVFENLQFLLIVNAHLVLWEASTKTFPCLRYLVLKNCENLREIPQCLCQGNLENLEIERLRKSAVESAKKIETARKEKEDPDRGKWAVRFKLNIGPGCEQTQN